MAADEDPPTSTREPPPPEAPDSLPPVQPSELEEGIGRGRHDVVVQIRMFAAITLAVGAMAAIYWVLSYENAGTVMLVLTAGLSAICGGFLLVKLRAAPSQAVAVDARLPRHDTVEYLPHASIWPFGIGLAAFFVTNGLILGVWFLVPGVLLALVSVIGFARQSRHRD